MAKKKTLTIKQKKFIDFYLKTGNATESCKLAGYKAKSETAYQNIGSQNLAKLKHLIEPKLKELDSKRIATVEEVLEFYTSAMRGELKEEVVVVEGIDKGVSEARVITKQISAKERLKAGELLGKRYLLFTEKDDNKNNTPTGEFTIKVVDGRENNGDTTREKV